MVTAGGRRDERRGPGHGLDLVEPGVTQASHWRSDPGTAVPDSQMWCGLGSKVLAAE